MVDTTIKLRNFPSTSFYVCNLQMMCPVSIFWSSTQIYIKSIHVLCLPLRIYHCETESCLCLSVNISAAHALVITTTEPDKVTPRYATWIPTGATDVTRNPFLVEQLVRNIYDPVDLYLICSYHIVIKPWHKLHGLVEDCSSSITNVLGFTQSYPEQMKLQSKALKDTDTLYADDFWKLEGSSEELQGFVCRKKTSHAIMRHHWSKLSDTSAVYFWGVTLHMLHAVHAVLWGRGESLGLIYRYTVQSRALWARRWFNIKMSSYQYRKSHCGDKTIFRLSYLHNGISYTGKMASLYWIRAQVFTTVASGGTDLKDSVWIKAAGHTESSTRLPPFHRMTFSNARIFCVLIQILLNFLFPGIQLTKSQHWFRKWFDSQYFTTSNLPMVHQTCDKQLPEPMLTKL